MGKTTLISLIYLYLVTNGWKAKVVSLFDSPRKPEEILQPLLRGLGLSPMEESKSHMRCRLDAALAKRTAAGEPVALIIDEAQNLRREVLEEILLLANPSPKVPALLQEIFVADPQFEKDLRSKDLSLLNQRMEARCRLQPFTPEESLGYIEHRLNLAGSSTSRVFTPRAASLIAQTAGGNPGILATICREALLLGYNQFKKRIDPGTVREALANLRMGKGYGWVLSLKNLPGLKRAGENPALSSGSLVFKAGGGTSTAKIF